MPTRKARPSKARPASRGTGPRTEKWVRGVKTVSTLPPKGTFTKDAESIARTMANKKVSPKGIGSAIRMIQFFINRAGRGLPKARRRRLERAKEILRKRHEAS